MSLALFFTLLFIFSETATTASPENLIPTLKSKNITAVNLLSRNPETISLFLNTNISLILSIPNSLIPSISSNSSATSAWLSTYVTPFLPLVRISAISVGNNVTDATLIKLVIPAIHNVKEKVKELGIERVKVSTSVSLGFVTGSESVAKALLGSLSENGVTSLFVNVKPWNVSLDLSFKEIVCGGFGLMRDLSTDVSYVSLDNDEMMDYGVVEVRVLKAAEDIGKKDDTFRKFRVCIRCIIYINFMLLNLQSLPSRVRNNCNDILMFEFNIILFVVCAYAIMKE